MGTGIAKGKHQTASCTRHLAVSLNDLVAVVGKCTTPEQAAKDGYVPSDTIAEACGKSRARTNLVMLAAFQKKEVERVKIKQMYWYRKVKK